MSTRPLSLSVVILAAGQGKRMKSDLPKVLQPLAGRPLLKHVIDTARRLEPSSVHVVYGHGGDRVRETLKDEQVSWVLQAEQLGTGHAVMQAAKHLHDDEVVLVLYGDVPLTRSATLDELLSLAGAKAMSLLTVMLDDPTGYGRVIRDSKGQVQKIVEQKDASKKELLVHECNSGVMAMHAKLLKSWLSRLSNDNAQGEYYLTDVIAMAVKDGIKVNPLVVQSATEVLGVNDKVQLAEVEAAHRREKARELMLSGVTIVDPARIDIRGTVTTGKDVYLDVNVVLEGKVTLGDRVRIGPNCVIKDCEIAEDTEVLPNSVLDKAVIGPQCHIGPFARLRPSSTLARGVHIGNFVEVKNSKIAEGSKANHLTYLGDSIVGSKVNVGAGTVTCNYDGANKSQTHIEDGAFIGSGSMLVAPVRVGAGATIGAGSTINKDAPAEKLTVARAKQVTLENWKRPVKKLSP
jgi:bifunctional UDP-N-acetylglucosamine pyrophosphorylase / glucosamine-1-phosphate N-acetyltransferase